ncbi:MAG: electron transport complex subunit RsxE [Proteobacteria bacterium]|nr:electron transport complex subunit RsxE [Pseudomonadota bacterium]
MIKKLKEHLTKHNIIFAQSLGLCPALAVSSNANSAFVMGVLTLCVLVASSSIVSLLRHFVPKTARIPIFIVIIAGLVTIADIFMQAYYYEQHKLIGIFIPLIVVNCSVLANAETMASKSNLKTSIIESIIAGIGFTFAITLIGILREFLALGTIFEIKLVNISGMLIFITPAGAFITLGLILAIINKITKKDE